MKDNLDIAAMIWTDVYTKINSKIKEQFYMENNIIGNKILFKVSEQIWFQLQHHVRDQIRKEFENDQVILF